MSSSKNLEFEKTSFLNKSNSAFIEQMYLKFLNKDPDLPEGWANYFEGIGEEINLIAMRLTDPHGAQKKIKLILTNYRKKLKKMIRIILKIIKLTHLKSLTFNY